MFNVVEQEGYVVHLKHKRGGNYYTCLRSEGEYYLTESKHVYADCRKVGIRKVTVTFSVNSKGVKEVLLVKPRRGYEPPKIRVVVKIGKKGCLL